MKRFSLCFNSIANVEHQKNVAAKKEEQIRALQKKATEVARAALTKKRELDNYNNMAFNEPALVVLEHQVLDTKYLLPNTIS